VKGIPGEVIGGRYRIERAVGQGGFGMVFAGRQINLDRPVAIKVMRGGMESPEVSRERFRREAVWTGALNHPNIVTYHDFLVDDDNDMVLVMEFLQGSTLDEVINPAGRLEARRAATLVAGAARGLAEAHRNGIVHRDVKPSNIFVTWPGTRREDVKVIDFGILWADPCVKGDHDGLTRENAFIGTPDYVAPEVLVGGAVTGRTDQYGLALVLLRAITGAKPWPGRGGPALLARLAMRPSLLDDPAVSVHPVLHGALFKALSPEPGDRFPDMDGFADALHDAVEAMSTAISAEQSDGPTVLEVRGARGDESVPAPVSTATPVGAAGSDASIVDALDLSPIAAELVEKKEERPQLRARRRGFTPAALLVLAALVALAAGAFAVVRGLNDLGGVQFGAAADPSPTGQLAESGPAVGEPEPGFSGPAAAGAAHSSESAGARAVATDAPVPEPDVGDDTPPASASAPVPYAIEHRKPAPAAGLPVERPNGASELILASRIESGVRRQAGLKTSKASSAKPGAGSPTPERPGTSSVTDDKAPPASRPDSSGVSKAAGTASVTGPALSGTEGRGPGSYVVNVKPYAYVSINGRDYGRTPVGPIRLDPGTYKVVFTHEHRPSFSRTIVVEAGRETFETFPYPGKDEGN